MNGVPSRRSRFWDWRHWAWGKMVEVDEWGDTTTIRRYGPLAIVELRPCECDRCAEFREKIASADLDDESQWHEITGATIEELRESLGLTESRGDQDE